MSPETTTLEERLYDYFIQSGVLSIPGVGTFRLQRISPHADVVSGRLLPPSFTVRYDRREDAPSREMFDYLARSHGGDDMKAIRSVNHLAHSLRTKLLGGESCGLHGIGTLLPDNGTGFRFDPETVLYDFNPHVRIRRVRNHDANAHLLVGEEWVSMSEQEERLRRRRRKGRLGEVPPVLWGVILASLAFLLAVGIVKGFQPFMPRYSPFTPVEPAPTHAVLN